MDISRSVIVTGSGSGIGAHIALAIAEPGTGIILHARKNAEGVQRVATAAQAKGASCAMVMGDLSEPETCRNLVAAARNKFGRVDQIVSNAGQAKRGGFGQFDAHDLDMALQSMPVAFFHLVDGALADLEQSEWGRVVAISSFIAHRFGSGGLLFGATAAAKAALEALAKTLAFQLAPMGTTVNCVAPGFTLKGEGGHSAAPGNETVHPGMAATPRGVMGSPDDVAQAVRFLLSKPAAHITGQILHVDGGLLLS